MILRTLWILRSRKEYSGHPSLDLFMLDTPRPNMFLWCEHRPTMFLCDASTVSVPGFLQPIWGGSTLVARSIWWLHLRLLPSTSNTAMGTTLQLPQALPSKVVLRTSGGLPSLVNQISPPSSHTWYSRNWNGPWTTNVGTLWFDTSLDYLCLISVFLYF